MARFDLSKYVLVEDRITEFWAKYPQGKILTEVFHLDPPDTVKRMVLVKASVWRNDTDMTPTTTGWAKEREGTMGANLTAFLENAETSAIGRALANLGIATKLGRPSRQEMEAVDANLTEHETILDTIKEMASAGSVELQKKVKARWKLLKEDRIQAAKFLEEIGAEYSPQNE